MENSSRKFSSVSNRSSRPSISSGPEYPSRYFLIWPCSAVSISILSWFDRHSYLLMQTSSIYYLVRSLRGSARHTAPESLAGDGRAPEGHYWSRLFASPAPCGPPLLPFYRPGSTAGSCLCRQERVHRDNDPDRHTIVLFCQTRPPGKRRLAGAVAPAFASSIRAGHSSPRRKSKERGHQSSWVRRSQL